MLGHALYMKAIHGGKVNNDRIDSQKIAQMRSTRDLLRRRMYLVRRQAELLGHIQNTRHQYNLPALEKAISRSFNREGIADHFDDPMVAASIRVDANMLDSLHQQILFVEREIKEQARHHDPVAAQLLQTIPGIGKTLGLTILYEIGDVKRFPSVGQFIPCARLVKCSHESAGKRFKGSNSKIGNAHLKWAFSEAACLFRRECEQAKALSIMSQRLGRAAYLFLKRRTPWLDALLRWALPFGAGERRLAQPVDSTPEPTPVRLIGPTLRSRFDIAELTPRAWFIDPPRVDPPM